MGCNCGISKSKGKLSKEAKVQVKFFDDDELNSLRLIRSTSKESLQNNIDKQSVNGLSNDATEASYSSSLATSPNSLRSPYTPAPVLHWPAWKAALQLTQTRVPGKYAELKKRRAESKWLGTIIEDVARSSFGCACEGEMLENVLAAYSVREEKVGYCQGMNYVAGMLLVASGMEEEDAFWAFTALMEKKLPNERLLTGGVKDLFTEGFPLAVLLKDLFETVLQANDPELHKHLAFLGFSTDLWFHKWVSSLFLYSFPLSYCTVFWNAFLNEGISFVLAIVCAILGELALELKRAGTMEECNAILKLSEEVLRETLPSPQKIVSIARTIKVDWEELGAINKKYESRIRAF
eukprot:TRINITY_DN4787_c0_g7_i3.p1 TRINITY_DN4787_c0_g7~~TRINITY_DN4787_c0_g7_i3.p1  ORF type:complete len:350 (-),score=62.32 TRINITY_DN4787_c0_g7_i3:245-1294(-)